MHACRHRLGPDQRQPSLGPALPPAMPRHHPCLAPLPAPLGLRFRALLGLGFVPPPGPSPAPIAPPSPTRCSRHPRSSVSPPSRSRIVVWVVAIGKSRPPRPHRAHRVPPSASLYVATEQIPRSSPPHRAHRAPTSASRPISLLALRRPQGPDWQEPHRMHPFFAECAKKAPFLATSARNACFSRSGWQHPRPMHPFPGAIGRFGIHGARILPPRALFRVEEPEITHGAKMLPAPPGLSPAAACGPAERALRHATAACGTRHGRTGFAPCGAGLACLPHAPPPVISLVSAAACAPCHLARVHRRRLIRVVLRRPHRAHRAQPSAKPPIAVGASRRSGSSCCPRAAHADASRPPQRHRHRPSPSPSLGPGPEPTESRPPVEPSAPTRAPPPAAPHPAARVPLRFW